jgi:predicted transposase/invertase (TIGR01784 family)
LDIEYKIVDITYRNLEKLGLNILDRKAIFDIYCTDERGDNFIVELQRSKQKYFRDRSVYYTTFPIQEQSKRGSWDYYLRRVYFIGILEFKMDDTEEYIRKVQLMDTQTKDIFYDKLTYYYIEIPKFKKSDKELSSHLDYWIWYLSNLAKIDYIPPKLEEYKPIKEAFDIAEFLALDRDKQFAYQLDLKARLDYKNVMDYAKETAKEEGRKEGRKEGIEKGKKEEKIKIAKNLLDILDIETISLKTGLSIEEIKSLK